LSEAIRLDHLATLENLNGDFLVRCQINASVYSQVISIVTKYGVLFVGFLHGDGVEVLARTSLPEAVDPDQTSAFWDGDRLELTISKIGNNGAPA
jgi:hypothetical protein